MNNEVTKDMLKKGAATLCVGLGFVVMLVGVVMQIQISKIRGENRRIVNLLSDMADNQLAIMKFIDRQADIDVKFIDRLNKVSRQPNEEDEEIDNLIKETEGLIETSKGNIEKSQELLRYLEELKSQRESEK